MGRGLELYTSFTLSNFVANDFEIFDIVFVIRFVKSLYRCRYCRVSHTTLNNMNTFYFSIYDVLSTLKKVIRFYIIMAFKSIGLCVVYIRKTNRSIIFYYINFIDFILHAIHKSVFVSYNMCIIQ